ncbi:transposase-like protein [Symbiobacterium terraclitae]|uniref:Transposase-like protein n=1 Tax=Symbiobacterium terraclitae TaxID=557451 RepID=A0ABS4JNJ1_9FIRM|nr:IS1 family transposase [Symbiobacterium terraclitae]MBP2017111.1 transposase-like protein [Symbiobacterium terraclitae]
MPAVATLQHDLSAPPHGDHTDLMRVSDGAREDWAPRPAERESCPRCQSSRVVRNGTFRLASGDRVQRYLCQSCRRTFSPLTGKPAYRLRKLPEWNAMVQLLRESLSLRRTASLLKISVSTAFHWRHRALAALTRKARRLGGAVSVSMCLVKYSEKGSRVCNGPGSWGYWNILRHGPHADERVRPPVPGGARRRFRLLIDGRPVGVMAAQSGQTYELAIVGQGRISPEYLAKGLAQLVERGSHVYAFGWPELRGACEILDLTHHNGYAAMANQRQQRAIRPADARWPHPDATPIRCPVLPDYWLRRFRGVATRYLAHYLAWFRDIVPPAPHWPVAALAAHRVGHGRAAS